MSKSVKWILVVLGVLIVGLIAVKAIQGKSDTGTKVTAEKASIGTVIETVTASGKVYPEVEVKISPDVAGEITELNVEEGDSVRKGQVLARIYAEIRRLSAVPMVALIYRHLATIPGALEWAWGLLEPAMRSGHVQEQAWRLAQAVAVPAVHEIPRPALRVMGIGASDEASIIAVLEAYNRANPVNIVSLRCLAHHLAGGVGRVMDAPVQPAWQPPPWASRRYASTMRSPGRRRGRPSASAWWSTRCCATSWWTCRCASTPRAPWSTTRPGS